MPLTPHLHRVAERVDLSAAEAYEAMSAILSGRASAPQIAALLVALRMKGESPAELLGFARAMREASTRVEPRIGSDPLVDTCGMGGDGAGTFNISTVAAFVVAGAGVRVAKHGNRSISSRCGSADVLERLGVQVTQTAERAARSIEEVGIGFLFAPAFHPAMKHAQPVRAELRMRTIFNMLGPLANPAGATAQVVGAASPRAAELISAALAELGLPRGFVVHGSDGLDEVTLTGPTAVFEIAGGKVTRTQWDPGDFGLDACGAEHLKGGSAEENAALARAILCGEAGPQRDIVLANAAAALWAAGAAADLRQAMEMAAASITSGAAQSRLEALAAFTRSGA